MMGMGAFLSRLGLCTAGGTDELVLTFRLGSMRARWIPVHRLGTTNIQTPVPEIDWLLSICAHLSPQRGLHTLHKPRHLAAMQLRLAPRM